MSRKECFRSSEVRTKRNKNAYKPDKNKNFKKKKLKYDSLHNTR